MLGCPEQSVLARFVEGGLGQAEREAVATHLDGCMVCLEVAAAAAPSLVGDAPPAAPRDFARGESVGRYVLLEKIGAGGLGEVFAAYDPKLDRRIAIKVGRPGLWGNIDPAQEDRALREAQVLARLSHPNIVAVHDVGTFDGRLFIAMEFIEGETLREWGSRTRPKWSTARDVYLEAARGLAAAHAAGFVHRDFKPANVMRGPGDRVRVLDFGLVGLRADTSEATVGTPAYMAPEQRGGDSVDARADQYAFCVSLWECIFGARPGGDAPASPTPAPPGWLLRALKQGLEEEPARRHTSMSELTAALTRDHRRKRHWRWAAAGALVSAFASAAVVSLREPSPVEGVEDEIARLSHAAQEAAAKANFVYPPPDTQERTAFSFVLALDALGDRGREAAAGLRREFADTLVRLGDRYWDAEGGRPFAVDYYAAALVFAPDDAHALGRAALTRGELATLRQHAESGEFAEAERAAARALAALAEEDADERDAKIVALLERDESVGHSTRLRLRRLIRSPDAGTSAPRPGGPASDKAGAASEPDEAGADADAGAAAGASPAAGEADGSPHAGKRGPKPADHGRAAQIVAQARAARRAGSFKRAEALFHQALDVGPRNFGALRGLAEMHWEQGKYAKALPFARSAAKSRPKDAGLQILLGKIYFRSHRYADARAAFKRADKLGHPDAKAGIDRVNKRTSGKSP